MTDPGFDFETTEDDLRNDPALPEFGLVDVVEAFTAMRHEWRGQTKENRTAVDAVQNAVSALHNLEQRLRAEVMAGSTDESRKLIELVVDVDHHLTRTIAAFEQAETNRLRREAADADAVQRYFDAMNPIARRFARPLAAFVAEQHRARTTSADSAAIDGLHLVLSRLRRAMKEHHIERIDTLGEPFDATTMNAIGAIETAAYAPGHVAEQLSAGYRWSGRMIRFADVRVATPGASEAS